VAIVGAAWTFDVASHSASADTTVGVEVVSHLTAEVAEVVEVGLASHLTAEIAAMVEMKHEVVELASMSAIAIAAVPL
jgi:hypothetical protein